MTKIQRLRAAVEFLETMGFHVYVTTQKRGAEGEDYVKLSSDEAVVLYEERLSEARWQLARLKKEG